MTQDKVIGKLSDDAVMSCSRLPALFGWSSYATPNDELRKSMEAWDRKNGVTNLAPRAWQYSEPASWGIYMENEILRRMAQRLGLEIQVDVEERVEHAEIDLQGSLDGILFGDGRVITTDPSAGIYVIGADSVTLDGPGVAESKLTNDMPAAEPKRFRGPAQVQGLMMCTGYKWAAIGTLFRGTELRIFVVGPDPVMQQKIREDVTDFAARMELWQTQRVAEWYPALTPNDAAETYTKIEDDLPPVKLDAELSELAMDLMAARAAAAAATKLATEIQTRIMDAMGLHPTAVAFDESGNPVAEISWGMSSPRKEYVVKAQPARRASSIKIKEIA